jgi:hypothetical protein
MKRLRDFVRALLHGRPNPPADFHLPSAEGNWGYPADMVEQGGELVAAVMIGMVEVVGARHLVMRASERPDCLDGDKGKLFARCNSSLRVWLDPTTHAPTCKRCLAALQKEKG